MLFTLEVVYPYIHIKFKFFFPIRKKKTLIMKIISKKKGKTSNKNLNEKNTGNIVSSIENVEKANSKKKNFFKKS
jgi:hypothetical protein